MKGHLTTIDNDVNFMNVSKVATKKYQDSITYIVQDSIEALSRINHSIDLLYLDSLDVIPGRVEHEDHCLSELMTSYSKLSDRSIVLIDDFILDPRTREYTGKGAKVIRYLCNGKKDWTQRFILQQGVFERNAVRI